MNDPWQSALKTLKNVDEQGFRWPSFDPLSANVIDEVREIKEALLHNEGDERLLEEVGDLLLGALEICRFLSIDPEKAIIYAHTKFKARFEILMKIHQSESQKSLHDLTPEELYGLWKKAKEQVKMVPPERIEPSTSPLPRVCSTTEPRRP